MHTSAQGTFEVNMAPLSPSPGDGLSRMSLQKSYQGDLDGSSAGEMISAGDPRLGAAGYVAMERITGRLGGQAGSFALQQSALMDATGHSMTITIVPGSGTQGLRGIAGTMAITVTADKHFYDLSYTLPQQ